ncbi:MAG: lytic murein transglycosylase [Mesorhizobium sp.]|nr:lytic murein transglycosylase [Mesorhizobium sp. M1A.T.Ca.IN.004.03.1.1]RWG02703.1 MAG: lytic murein transglycosylase [Mesorhizobium sp.]RWG21642.1 MAG: lytic murein transglycosylase [Mesorhizobium sp.]RWG96889.1 MAG: lytic murein transglycosylase [Mesorhizobium sp.]RWI88770.1 MAG: lytic murein transglycosylase [Mesorhizobium sp.]
MRHTPLCPAGHLPRKEGDWMSRKLLPNRRRCREGAVADLLISPKVGDMAGKPEAALSCRQFRRSNRC